MTDEVRNNPSLSRYELDVEGHTAVAYYERSGDVVTFMHTEVPQELSGRGIGSRLARGALDAVRAEELKVVAECPFMAGYIAKHTEYIDLVHWTGMTSLRFVIPALAYWWSTIFSKNRVPLFGIML
jgi:predicted GNAT family acetyltransferase